AGLGPGHSKDPSTGTAPFRRPVRPRPDLRGARAAGGRVAQLRGDTGAQSALDQHPQEDRGTAGAAARQSHLSTSPRAAAALVVPRIGRGSTETARLPRPPIAAFAGRS